MKHSVWLMPPLVCIPVLLLIFGCATGSISSSEVNATKFRAYVGTYTGAKSQGIYTFTFDIVTGEFGPVELAGAAVNPSFLALSPDRKHLYAVGEIGDAGKKGGVVSAFAIQPDGKLTLLNQVSTVGAGPCHLTVDKTGRMLLAANYGGGSVVSFPIKPDGSLGEHTGFVQHTGRSVTPRQSQPNAHSVNITPDNRFVFVADLGLDQILTYKIAPATATFSPHDPASVKIAPGSGPRHLCFSPNGKFAYLINEMALTVTAFRFDAANGTLSEIQTISTLPSADRQAPKSSWSTAEIALHPNGQFLYGSNRVHDTITVFAIAGDGKLSLVENVAAEVKVPRNFALDPTGLWLFAEGQKSDGIALFRVDSTTGKITFTGKRLEVGSPVCMKFVPLR